MRVWAPANIDKIRLKRKMTSQGLLRTMTIAAPKHNLEPSFNHLRNIIKGKTKNPGVSYAILFADALKCSLDDLCIERD